MLWLLLVLLWTGQLSLWATFLIGVLLPEGLCLPRRFDWTTTRAIAATLIPLAGSAVWSSLAVLLLRLGAGRRT